MSTYRIVVIDDLREFTPSTIETRQLLISSFDEQVEVVYLKTSQEALSWFEQRLPIDELWLDHDLGLHSEHDAYVIAIGLELEGYSENPYPVRRIYLHTANPTGLQKMRAALEKYYNVFDISAEEHGLINKEYH